jgi:phosphonate transport system permease protein
MATQMSANGRPAPAGLAGTAARSLSDTRLAQIEAAYAGVVRRRNLYTALMMALCALVIVGGFRTAEEANSGTFWGGITAFLDYPADIVGEAYEAGWGWFAVMGSYVPELIETVKIALLSTVLGFAGGGLLSFVASRNLVGNKAVVWAMRRVMDVTRALPELVLALFAVLVIGPEALAAVFAIAFHTTGALAKLFSEVNENADMRPVHGLQAAGSNWVQRMRFGVLPTVLPNFLSYALLRLEINVRASAIVGFVGAGGLGQALKTNVGWKHGADVAAIMVLLVLTIIVIDYVSSWARRQLTGSGSVI